MKKLFFALMLCHAALAAHTANAADNVPGNTLGNTLGNITVKVGVSNTSSDVGIYIAQEKGYFQAENITATTIPFSSAAQMIAPLGTGDLAVGSGSATAGLYNAVARGIAIQIVADGASAPPGYGHNILLVRKALLDSGRFKTLADLKNMHVALTAIGASSTAMMNTILQKAGLSFADIDPVYLGYPDHVIALANAKVDAALTAEPSATQAIAAGSAVRITSEDEFAPYHVGSVILFSGDFAKNHADTAQHFINAYVRAIRYYRAALTNGHIAGPNAEEIIDILVRTTTVKNPKIYRDITPQSVDPDGTPNPTALKQDFDFYKSQGWLNSNATFDQALNLTFVQTAAKSLGRFQDTK